MNEFLTCDRIKNMISSYFDMELSDEDMKLVENHIESCPDCRQELENIRRLSSLIKTSWQKDASYDDIPAVKGLLPAEIEKCLSIKSGLSEFIDGELPREKTVEILEHVINCEFCRNQYEKIKEVSNLTRNYLENSYNDEVFIEKQKTHTRVIEKIRQLKNRKKILTSAVAVVFIAVLGWFSAVQFTSTKPEDININKTRYIRTERPMYVKSEEFILTELDSEPPKEVVSLIYGN